MSFRFSTLFVNPPRKGLDAYTRAVLAQFPTVMYISCNMDTLQRDLTDIASTHRVQAAAFFDQFPGPRHAEVGLLLERRDLVTYKMF